MTTNNEYLKSIAETVTETEISGTHTDNYYLKLICTTYGYTYTGTVCDGKLIKDFASYITSKTYNRIHFDNKYYHDIAESLTGNTYDNKYDNFYLGIIAENITPPTPVMTLDHIGVELIAGNQILSYADEQQTAGSQYATVRFTAYDAEDTVIPNLALDFKVGTGAVTTVTTDSDGRYEYTYHSQGIGDVEIVASKTVDGILVSKTYSIEDCWEYYDGSSVTGLSIDSGVSCTSNGSYITITKNTSGERYVYLSKTLANSDNWEFSVEIAQLGTEQTLAVGFNNATFYGGTSENDTKYFSAMGSMVSKNKTPSVGDVYKVIRENGVTTVMINDETIDSKTVSHNTSFKCGFYTNNGRIQNVKNIKLKPL